MGTRTAHRWITVKVRMKIVGQSSKALPLLLMLAPGFAAYAANTEKPNIIVIMADDLGYGELGCFGQTKIKTPHLDRMAVQGMRCTQVYSGSTVCAPTRCCLMTGLHTGHARVRGNAGIKGRVPLEPEDVTVAEVLRTAGYRTGIVGKWGLGEPGTTGIPNDQGFDFWFGYLNQAKAHFYYPPFLWKNREKMDLAQNADGRKGVYSHDMMTDEALAFVRRNQRDPFFLYVAYTIPHAEIVVPEDSLKEYRGKFPETPYPGAHYGAQPEPNAALAGMVTRMDRDIGRLFELLRELKLDENTIVFFTSDNGPVSVGGRDHKFFRAAGGLRGTKGSLFEGGIRVPTIVRWPGRIQAGTVSDAVWAHWDVLPTCAEIAGVEPPKKIDGVSVLPTLLGKDQPQLDDRFLYWEYGRNKKFTQAVRKGDWKAIRIGLNGPINLYDLKMDVAETTDVANQHPSVTGQIEKYLTTARTESKDFPTEVNLKPTRKSRSADNRK